MDNINELNKNLLAFDKELKKIGKLPKDKREIELTLFKQKNKNILDLMGRVVKIVNVDTVSRQNKPTITY